MKRRGQIRRLGVVSFLELLSIYLQGQPRMEQMLGGRAVHLNEGMNFPVDR